jgi:hypothetical protein
MYSSTKYTCLDISDHLLQKCKQSLEQEHEKLVFDQKVKFMNRDIVDYDIAHEEPIIFVFFEILDNFPHDKIIIDKQSNLVFQRFAFFF